MKRRPTALGAVAALVLSGVLVATPAWAAPLPSTGARPAVEAPAERAPAAFTSIESGAAFLPDDAPERYAGTGEPGERLTVTLAPLSGGQAGSAETVVSADGAWRVELAAPASAGLYEVSVGRASAPVDFVADASLVFRVDDPASPGMLPLSLRSPENGARYSSAEAPAGVSGSGEPGAAVSVGLVSAQGYEWSAETSVSARGEWHAAVTAGGAPLPTGEYTLTVAQAVGDDASQPVAAAFTVVDADFELAAVEGLEHGGVYAGPVSALSGTGEPGSTVRLSAHVASMESAETVVDAVYPDATVAADGTWSVDLDPALDRGFAFVAVDQFVDGALAYSTSASFELFSATTVSSIADGAEVAAADAPSGASGTLDAALDASGGAVATTATLVSQQGAESFEATGAVGEWSVDFGRALEPGEYTLTVEHAFADPAKQQKNGLPGASLSFSVVAPSGPAPSDDGAPVETDEPAAVEPPASEVEAAEPESAAPAPQASSGRVASDRSRFWADEEEDLILTGGESMLPYALGGVVLALIGGGALLIARQERPFRS